MFSSFYKNKVKDFYEAKLSEDYDEAQNDLGISEPNEKQEMDIAFLAGCNSGSYEIHKTKHANLLENIFVDGEEFESSDILKSWKVTMPMIDNNMYYPHEI